MITLSVVVPVRDGEPYIADALTSLVRNVSSTFRTEVIVVDDGSADATPEVVEDFRDDLPGLAVIRNPAPVGLADARNLGLRQATGRYVTFLDGDDWLAPGYLAQLVSAIEGFGCDFVRVDHIRAEGRKREIFRAPEARRNVVLDPRESILPAGAKTLVDYPFAWAGIYRRELGELLTFPSGLHTAEDRPWIWRLHQRTRSFAMVSLAGVFYRRGLPGSLTQVGDDRQLYFFDAFEQVFAEVEERFRPKAIRTFCALLVNHLEAGHRFTPETAARFSARATEVLTALPEDLLAEAIATNEPERQATLLRLKEGS
ncbi:glycosyltransferase family 2 protein [Planotetraspora phitsanulokensis]|uniref:Glycosyl transferase n=1 Tax=Planotetraspora phitsanulokensis TaxID=575192 RepID=A0A8J3UC94_9ACTN|nr:glycosyltransferase family 2 protein [Planotetraspora phitsanulokensis]GII42160.1 glycosyl transferase [Planotetraspora phitsanulokensis]